MKLNLNGRYGRYIPYAVCVLAAAMAVALMSGSGGDRAAREDGAPAPEGRDAPSTAGDEPPPGTGDPAADPTAAERELSRRLTDILSGVQGVGRVRVQVTLDSGPHVTYHEDTRTSDGETVEADAQGGTRDVAETTEERNLSVVRGAGGDEIPVVREVQGGQIRGVLVVAEGAGDPRIRTELSEAVATLLDIGMHRVTVLVGKGGE